MSMQSVKTEGASGPVYSQTFAVNAGQGTVLLPAIPGTGPQTKYRITQAQVSVGNNGTVFIYHGATAAAAQTAKKFIVGGIFAMTAPPAVFPFGDWANNNGSSNEPVCVDCLSTNAVITLQYQLL